MRKIEKKFDAAPAVLSAVRCDELIEEAIQAAVEKQKYKYKESMYRHSTVLQELDRLYRSRCAFCESDVTAGSPLQVEHFRPKGRVTEDNTHPGYYWLAYEWSNLLLACSNCNRHKSTFFPIKITGKRVEKHPFDMDGRLDRLACLITSPSMIGENSLLVNPETDPRPMAHFRFDSDGTMIFLTDDGQATIRICDLNRTPLRLRRKAIYDQIFYALLPDLYLFGRGLLNSYDLQVRLMESIRVYLISYMFNLKNQYQEFAKACWFDFERLFVQHQELTAQPQLQQHLRDAYNELRQIFNAA